MTDPRWRGDDFEEHRTHLRSVAYRMLGSASEADDAVQETWLRLNAFDGEAIENLGGWLTTVVSRVCLNMLRSRRQRREESLDLRMPDPIIDTASGGDPEHETLLASSVGIALLVVLDSLTPAERVAFVLHDLFAMPFDEIADLLDRTPAATRQLASRARRRVHDRAPDPDPDLSRQRTAVDAFFSAARNGDLEALVAVLDPDVVLRSVGGAGRPGQNVQVEGARNVAGQAVTFGSLSPYVRPAVINGAAGVVVVAPTGPLSIMAFSVVAERIIAIDVLADPDRLALLTFPDEVG